MPHLYMDDVRRLTTDKLGNLGAKGEHPSKKAERLADPDCGNAGNQCSCASPHETDKYMKVEK